MYIHVINQPTYTCIYIYIYICIYAYYIYNIYYELYIYTHNMSVWPTTYWTLRALMNLHRSRADDPDSPQSSARLPFVQNHLIQK